MTFVVSKTDNGPQSLKFEFRNGPLSVANALRRTCLSEVPLIGIDRESISFRLEDNNLNETSFHDEFLAHRISYVRLVTTKVDLTNLEFTICDPKDRDLPFVNDSEDIVDFTTKNIQIHDKTKGTKIKHDEVFVGECLLTRMKPGQRLKASMTLTTRPVRQKDKPVRYNHQPCRVKFYYKYSVKKGDVETVDSQLLYEGHETKTPSAICFEVATYDAANITAPEVMSQAFDVIADKVARLRDALQSEHTEDVTISEDPHVPGTVVFRITNEDYTLGHLLVQKVREIQLSVDSPGNYAAFQKAHPLEPVLVLKIRNENKQNPIETLLHACGALEKDLALYKADWERALAKSQK